jgi:D-lyxose ketol-isomerase
MKRSEINRLIEEALDLFDQTGFRLPPFAFWTPAEWAEKGPEANEIRENALGWDVTDYGLGDFTKTGLLLFTIRNGNYMKKAQYPKGYAEKIMVVREGQVAPMHFHWKKREDIINRGGGNLVIELYAADPQEQLAQKNFSVSVDGVCRDLAPGGRIVLTPGESICLTPFLYHSFYGEAGYGPVVVGEVSDVNDDERDNRFLQPIGRFPSIVEDEPPRYHLCNEYPPARR